MGKTLHKRVAVTVFAEKSLLISFGMYKRKKRERESRYVCVLRWP